MTDDAIRNRLMALQPDLPVHVARWEIEQGIDTSGSDAIWVWAILEDTDFNRRNTSLVRDAVWHALFESSQGSDGMVYIRFRTTSEVVPA